MSSNKSNILQLVETLHSLNHQNKLQEDIWQMNFQEVEAFADYCELTQIQALIFASCLILGYSGSSLAAVFRHFDLQEHELLYFRKDFDVLFKRKLLERVRTRDKRRLSFSVPDEVYNAVCNNEPLPEVEENKNENLIDILEEFNELSDNFDDNLLSEFEFKDNLKDFLKEHEDRPVFQEMQAKKLDLFESFFFLDTVWDAIISGNNRFNTNVESTINDFHKSKSRALVTLMNLIDGFSTLTKSDFVEVFNSEFKNRCRAKISKRMIKFLRENENLQIDDNSTRESKLISHKSIPQKTLYYNEETTNSVAHLNSLITEKSFSELQKRLKEKSMPVGITALFYGEPGTGKTESVYQIAKSSGRNIFQVDISETKSMWFGESQKLVKRIFTDYYEIKKKEKRCPILLFNEADAVIGKRKQAGSSNVSDTENAIQNILLEEIEKFNGILFATTNLVENLDNAFERRFLFKLRFEKPSVENSAKIWKDKLPFLNEFQTRKLAQNYTFSGGEMENIARKCLMNEIIHGNLPTFEEIQTFCKEENWQNKTQSNIGFQINA